MNKIRKFDQNKDIKQMENQISFVLPETDINYTTAKAYYSYGHKYDDFTLKQYSYQVFPFSSKPTVEFFDIDYVADLQNRLANAFSEIKTLKEKIQELETPFIDNNTTEMSWDNKFNSAMKLVG